MAVAVFMHWAGLATHHYNAVMGKLELDASTPAGSVLHLAALTADGLEVCEIWQTEQAFHAYLEKRLLPVLGELDFPGEPEVRVVPLHNLYAADPEVIDRIGAVSMPAPVVLRAV